MHYYRFLCKTHVEKFEYDSTNLTSFLISEDDGSTWLYLVLSSEIEAKIIAESQGFTKYEKVDQDLNGDVDWALQWSMHSPDFAGNSLKIDLSKYTKLSHPHNIPILQLNAGPGFGDLSHPTTRLTLAMMAPYINGKEVLDIGCGSGILSLSAILLGAKFVHGLDIDPDALSHAQENARLNDLEKHAIFLLPEFYNKPPSGELVILMNMIRTQQQEAWKSLPQLHHRAASCITSGILASEREIYLRECNQRRWNLVEEKQEEDWLAFHFEL